jgi:hypothetical protein
MQTVTKQQAKAEQQAINLIEFERLLNRRVPYYKWYDGAGPEPPVHKMWRMYASLLYRLELWLDAGLPTWPEMKNLISETRSLEREAYKTWLKLKRKISGEYISGKRKIRPPWGVAR